MPLKASHPWIPLLPFLLVAAGAANAAQPSPVAPAQGAATGTVSANYNPLTGREYALIPAPTLSCAPNYCPRRPARQDRN